MLSCFGPSAWTADARPRWKWRRHHDGTEICTGRRAGHAINAGIGKDEELKFFHSAREDIADSSSFVYNAHDDDVILENVQGYTLSSAMKKFNIPHIDFLKTDCKGCEFFLKEDDLVKVDKVKIEYESFTYTKHKLGELTKVLDNSNFEYVLYRLEPSRDNYSITEFGHLYGEKRK